MSYKALYRTHRPVDFDQVKGQDHIVSTLKNIILQDKVSHAYLFSGPRGTGKTSVAHVFAKTLNCDDLQNSTTPCKKCDSCLSATKTSMDIIEIDAASNNGVSEIRTLIENAKYAPSISKYKVYIIDEVHMLSKGAFNALLKTLEEPPKHVIFILATTEPHKIPVTILSRTQRFNFRRISDAVISARLIEVLKKEDINFDNESIKLIARLANGGMRDALSIADQVAAFSNGSLTFDAVSSVFGVVSTANQIKLITLAFKAQTKQLLQLAAQFIENGTDIERITTSLIDIIKDVIVYSKTSDIKLAEFLNIDEVESLKISNSFAYGSIDVLMKLLSDLRFSEVPRQAFELALLKLTELGTPEAYQPETVVVQQPVQQAPQPVQQVVQQVQPEPIPEPTPPMEEPAPAPMPEPIAPKPESEADFMNLFSSEELTQQNTESIFTPEKLEAIQEEMDNSELYDTATQLIKEEEEEDLMMQEIEEDIISTQEISITGEQVIDESTQEIDMMALFNINDVDEDKPVVADKKKYSVEEIINLLIQADRDQLASVKNNWASILAYSSNPKYGAFAVLLDASKVISAGKEFILVSSANESVIPEINEIRKNPKFIQFINTVFGRPLLLFAITKEEFEVIKQSWMKLSAAKELPSPTPIEKVTVEVEKETNKAEEFGSSLFGDIFNS